MLFCLGTLFQFQGAFGNPYLQQIAILVTWLPLALLLLQWYFYSYADSALTHQQRPLVDGHKSTDAATPAACNPAIPPPPTASCAATPTPALGSTPPGASRT
jgi:hypothetical protein